MEGGVASALTRGLVISRTAPVVSPKHHQPSLPRPWAALCSWPGSDGSKGHNPKDFPLEHREFASLLPFNSAAFASSGGILQLARRISLFTKELFFFSVES